MKEALSAKNLLRLKLFILSLIRHIFHPVNHENIYFIRGFATHDLYFFTSLDEITIYMYIYVFVCVQLIINLTLCVIRMNPF